MSDGGAILLFLLLVVVYFIPSFVAAGRKNNGGVIIVNLFLGWTLLGWVLALAWAASLPRDDPKSEPTGGPSGKSVATSAIDDTRLCPFCAEEIKLAAIVCKHCGRDLPRSDIAA